MCQKNFYTVTGYVTAGSQSVSDSSSWHRFKPENGHVGQVYRIIERCSFYLSFAAIFINKCHVYTVPSLVLLQDVASIDTAHGDGGKAARRREARGSSRNPLSRCEKNQATYCPVTYSFVCLNCDLLDTVRCP